MKTATQEGRRSIGSMDEAAYKTFRSTAEDLPRFGSV